MTPQGDVTKIPETPLRQLYDYWTAKRKNGRWPSPADIEQEEIAALLPYVMLVDVLDDGRHFRFRLIGTDVAIGVNPIGKLQHEELPEGIYRDHITALYRRGATGPGALYSRSAYEYAQTEGPRSISRLFLPLSTDGAAIDMMLIGQTADRDCSGGKSAWLANPPTITEEVEFRLP